MDMLYFGVNDGYLDSLVRGFKNGLQKIWQFFKNEI